MARFKGWTPEGVVSAVLLPFRASFSIDQGAASPAPLAAE
jgi:hypothetical protein